MGLISSILPPRRGRETVDRLIFESETRTEQRREQRELELLLICLRLIEHNEMLIAMLIAANAELQERLAVQS